MLRDESLSSLHVSVGDCAHDLRDGVRLEIDSHYSAGLRDVDMRQRMIEGVNPHLESIFTNDRRSSVVLSVVA